MKVATYASRYQRRKDSMSIVLDQEHYAKVASEQPLRSAS